MTDEHLCELYNLDSNLSNSHWLREKSCIMPALGISVKGSFMST